MIEAEALREAGAALRACTWALVGDCALASRCVHGHGAPGEPEAAVYLGLDAGSNLYGLQAPQLVLHLDVFHAPGRCGEPALRARLVEAARGFLAARGEPADQTQRLLAFIEARTATQDEGLAPGTPAAGPSGHVHLALRLEAVPLEFVPLAVEAAEAALADSGLAPLRLRSIEPTWESAQRPPCGCGTAGGPAAAGSAGGVRQAAREGGAAAAGTAGRAQEGDAAGVAVAGAHPAPDGRPRPRRVSLGRGGGAAATPHGTGARPRRRGAREGLLLAVETAATAAHRGAPLHPAPADLRYAPRRGRRPEDALIAVDRSPSMAGYLGGVGALAQALALSPGRRVGLWALPTAGAAQAAEDLPPTRDRAALRRAVARACGGTLPGETDLAGALRALAEHLRTRGEPRRLACYIVTDGLATGRGDPFAAARAAAAALRALPRVRVIFCGWAASADRLRALAAAAGARRLTLPDP